MYLYCLLPLRDINFPTVMVQYSLFVLKVLLNPKQANKQTNDSSSVKLLAELFNLQ